MLSAKQVQFVTDDAPFVVADGSVRSSKTLAQIIKWMRWLPDAPRTGLLLVTGRTADTVGRNILEVIVQLDPRAIQWTPGANVCTIMGRRCTILGANDIQAESKIRGATVAGALVDEITLLPETYFNQLINRMSVVGARLFGTTNPDSPNHWYKKNFLDRNLKGWSKYHFTLDDNPGLTEEFKDQIKESNVGMFYDRFVLGLWVSAEGAIYTEWDRTKNVVPWEEMPVMARYVAVGIDQGTTNATSAILVGQDSLGRYWLVDEYRYTPSEDGGRLTDAEQSKRVIEWLLRPHHPVRDCTIDRILIDPAAASFRVQMNADGITSEPADNRVVEGISVVSSLMRGKLLVSSRCTGFLSEVEGYVWDPKATKRGEDAPVKINDHSMDAARYGIMADFHGGSSLAGD